MLYVLHVNLSSHTLRYMTAFLSTRNVPGPLPRCSCYLSRLHVLKGTPSVEHTTFSEGRGVVPHVYDLRLVRNPSNDQLCAETKRYPQDSMHTVPEGTHSTIQA